MILFGKNIQIALADAGELGLKKIQTGTPNTINNSFTEINGTSQSLVKFIYLRYILVVDGK